MTQQGFFIGERDWWLMVGYGVDGHSDLDEVYGTLLTAAGDDRMAQRACMVLSKPNTGYTYSDLNAHFTIIFISRATSAEQMYDSIVHELKHAVEHISDYYGVDPKSEQAAYLQGEIGRKMFPAAALHLCPRCS